MTVIKSKQALARLPFDSGESQILTFFVAKPFVDN